MTQHNPNSPDLDTRRRRAHYRAHHRGTQEMDLLLGRYGAAKLAGMNAAQLDVFERLLDQPDPDLQRRLMAPAGQDGDNGGLTDTEALIGDIRRFHGLANNDQINTDRRD